MIRSTIICVDDDKFLVDTLVDQIRDWLGENYTVEKAISGSEALEIYDDCASNDMPVSLIISDYIMPVMTGDVLLAKIHEMDRSIRKIMLTGYTSIEGIVSAINKAGLYRFINKPWDKKDLMLTIIEAIKSYEQEKYNQNLLKSFERMYRGYEDMLNNIVTSVSSAVDMRMHLNAGHSNRVANISQLIGKKAGLDTDAQKSLKRMAAFHDIGKLILKDSDFDKVKTKEALVYDFPDYIAKQNEAAEKIFSLNSDMDKELLRGITNHYEKFDGTGVKKLRGKDIPIEARIIAIANFYDVLTSDISMVKPMKSESAVEMINSLRGSLFDPELVENLYKIDLKKI